MQGQNGAYFSQVAISGNKLLVGEPYYNKDAYHGNVGRAQFYQRSGGQWASDGQFPSAASSGSIYGAAVAMAGSWAVVGQPFSGGSQIGAIFRFKYDGTQWSSSGIISRGSQTGQFGAWRGLAMTSDTIVASAYANDGSQTNEGGVWVFTRTGGMWDNGVQISSPLQPAAFAEFGRAVAVDDTTLAVSSFRGAGMVHIFRKINGLWVPDYTIYPPAGVGSEFGFEIDLDGDLLVVGARKANVIGTDSGAVCVYRDQGLNQAWLEEATLLTGNDTAPGDRLGSGVAIKGLTVFAGAPNAGNRGAVYMFRPNSHGIWTQVQRIQPSSVGVGDEFGHSVEASGKWLAIGSPSGSGAGSSTGRVYILNHLTCPMTTL